MLCPRGFSSFLKQAGEQPVVTLRRKNIQENYQSRAKHTQKYTQPKEKQAKKKNKRNTPKRI
jgi:hypothetical protein